MKESKTRNTEDIKGVKANLVSKQRITDWLTSERMFLTYRYRQQDIRVNPKTLKLGVFHPYVKDEDSSNHRYALKFPQWQEIVQTYFDIVVEHLLKGIVFEFPRNMGHLEMCKIKMPTVVMRGLKTSFRNLSTLGYKPKLVWRKKTIKGMNTKWWFLFNISKKRQWVKMGRLLRENPSIIFEYPDVAHTKAEDRIQNIKSHIVAHKTRK